MKIALISGLWPSKDENGLRDLAWAIQRLGHQADNYHYTDDIDPELYDAFIGHSFGCNTTEDLMKRKSKPAAYAAFIEGVHYFWSQKQWDVSHETKSDCFLRRGWRLPPSVAIKGQLPISISGLDHGNAPRNQLILATILRSIATI